MTTISSPAPAQFIENADLDLATLQVHLAWAQVHHRHLDVIWEGSYQFFNYQTQDLTITVGPSTWDADQSIITYLTPAEGMAAAIAKREATAVSFVTCSWYSPAQALATGQGAEASAAYEYDRLTDFPACSSPRVAGRVCGWRDHSRCPVYDPIPAVTVASKELAVAGTWVPVALTTVKLGAGHRFYRIERGPGEQREETETAPTPEVLHTVRVGEADGVEAAQAVAVGLYDALAAELGATGERNVVEVDFAPKAVVTPHRSFLASLRS